MPSPFLHAAVGHASSTLILLPKLSHVRSDQQSQLLLTGIALSCLPDADAIIGIALKDLKGTHNGITHSLTFGLLVAPLAAGMLRIRYQITFLGGFAFAFLSHILHLALDLLGRNKRGLLLLAPFSNRRYRFPVTLFYGVRWDEGPFSRRHLWTLATELMSMLLLRAITLRLRR